MFHKLYLLAFSLLLIEVVYSKVDPDISRNVTELITSKGYLAEDHDVITSDKYILTIQHILPRNKGNFSANSTKVVFLQHGLLGASSDWVLNSKEQSLGFILSDLGYDVWLGNVRGNTYGKRHLKYSTKDREFWQFTIDDMASKDLPAMIDYVLNKTSVPELIYIGHSQGTTIAFGLFSENPAYNKKVKLFVGLGPVINVRHISSPIRYLAPFAWDLETILNFIGEDEFLPSNVIIKILSHFCPHDHFLTEICENIFFLFNGIDPDQLNGTRIPVYASHDPAGTSALNIVHWAQLVQTDKFQKYDYGEKMNKIKYNQPTPPEYFPENITTPVALFYGANDNLADMVDVLLLQKRLHSLVSSYEIPYPPWGHIDFIFGIDAATLVYSPLIKLIQQY